YSVSHDLRAPLRHVMGFSQILLDEERARLHQRGVDYLTRVRDSAARMDVLIDSLLQLSRVGRMEMVVERCDISELARGAVRILREREPARDVSLVVDDGLIVRGDARLLRVALDNL